MKRTAALIVAGASATACLAATTTPTLPTPPDWAGVWALPDSSFVSAMQRVAHGNGPESPTYAPGYLATHMGFGPTVAGPGGGAPPPGIPGVPAGPATTPAAGGGSEANAASCRPNGVPAVMGVPVGYEFLLTRGLLTILIEEGPTIRQVYLDRSAHTPDADPSYTGESIGHWEGQTLVVDTTAISARAQFFFGVNTSGQTHLIERIHLVDHDHLRIDSEVIDPVALQKPWHYSWVYNRTQTDFSANVCDHDTDRDRNGEPDLTPPQ